MTAPIIVRELNPGATDHNPDQLYSDALRALTGFGRGSVACESSKTKGR
jgi:hypothetical protein